MDYYALEHCDLPIELMMENTGLHLARLIVEFVSNSKAKILIGIGLGYNTGGGLFAARRLAIIHILRAIFRKVHSASKIKFNCFLSRLSLILTDSFLVRL